MLTLRVADLMRPCDENVISVTARLRDAALVLISSPDPLLIGVDQDSRFTGIVSESAVVRALLTASSADASIEPILSRHVESARGDAMLTSVLPLFRDACHAVIPVVDADNRVLGLLHRRDVVRLLLSDSPVEGHPVPTPHFLNAKNQPRRETADGGPAAGFLD